MYGAAHGGLLVGHPLLLHGMHGHSAGITLSSHFSTSHQACWPFNFKQTLCSHCTGSLTHALTHSALALHSTSYRHTRGYVQSASVNPHTPIIGTFYLNAGIEAQREPHEPSSSGSLTKLTAEPCRAARWDASCAPYRRAAPQLASHRPSRRVRPRGTAIRSQRAPALRTPRTGLNRTALAGI